MSWDNWEKKIYTSTIAIIYKDSTFKNYSYQETLNNPTNNTEKVLKAIVKLFDKTYSQEKIRLIGVRISNLTTNKQIQISSYDENEEQDNKVDNIQGIIDEINKKFGSTIVLPASLKRLQK